MSDAREIAVAELGKFATIRVALDGDVHHAQRPGLSPCLVLGTGCEPQDPKPGEPQDPEPQDPKPGVIEHCAARSQTGG